MSRFVCSLVVSLLFGSSCFAAEAPAAPTVPINVNSNDIQIIAAALNMASDTCTQQTNGCVIGLNKPAILAKLQAAAAELANKPPGK